MFKQRRRRNTEVGSDSLLLNTCERRGVAHLLVSCQAPDALAGPFKGKKDGPCVGCAGSVRSWHVVLTPPSKLFLAVWGVIGAWWLRHTPSHAASHCQVIRPSQASRRLLCSATINAGMPTVRLRSRRWNLDASVVTLAAWTGNCGRAKGMTSRSSLLEVRILRTRPPFPRVPDGTWRTTISRQIKNIRVFTRGT